MEKRTYLAIGLGVASLAMLLIGLYWMLFPSVTFLSQQKETTSAISLPNPVPAQSTRQVTFAAQAGDYITFRLIPETGFPPMPLSIMGGTITVSVYFGSQVLYSNTAQEIEGTVSLPQTGIYAFQIANNNDFEIVFLSAPNVDASGLLLHHPYMEYSQVPNTAMQSYGFMLLMGAIIVGVAAVLTLTLQQRKV